MKEAIDSLLQKYHGGEGHPEACGSRLCRHGPSVCQRSQLLAAPHNQAAHIPLCKAPGKTSKHQFFFEHKPGKTSGDSAAVALFNRGE